MQMVVLLNSDWSHRTLRSPGLPPQTSNLWSRFFSVFPAHKSFSDDLCLRVLCRFRFGDFPFFYKSFFFVVILFFSLSVLLYVSRFPVLPWPLPLIEFRPRRYSPPWVCPRCVHSRRPRGQFSPYSFPGVVARVPSRNPPVCCSPDCSGLFSETSPF